MKAYLFPGALGLLTGLLLHWSRLDRRDELQASLALRRTLALRSGLTALGWAMAMTALLCWLAVIDVDTITLLPLSLGAILGGGLFGVAMALCGFTPTTAFAGLTFHPLEALCVLLGCGGMTLLLPELDSLLATLCTADPYLPASLFRVTQDKPFLLSGGFLGLGCLGAVLIAIALCIPNPPAAGAAAAAPHPTEPAAGAAAAVPHPTEPAAGAAAAVPHPTEPAAAAEPQPTDPTEPTDAPGEASPDQPESEPPAAEAEPADPTEPTDAPGEASPDQPEAEPAKPDQSAEPAAQTLIALLPGEEPLVVDTALDAEDGENPDPDLASDAQV